MPGKATTKKPKKWEGKKILFSRHRRSGKSRGAFYSALISSFFAKIIYQNLFPHQKELSAVSVIKKIRKVGGSEMRGRVAAIKGERDKKSSTSDGFSSSTFLLVFILPRFFMRRLRKIFMFTRRGNPFLVSLTPPPFSNVGKWNLRGIKMSDFQIQFLMNVD